MQRLSHFTLGLALLLPLSGCSDQHLMALPSGNIDPIDEAPVDDPEPDPIDDPQPDPDPEPDPAEMCDSWLAPAWGWQASAPFEGMDAPTDDDGLPFWHGDFDAASWTGVVLPDTGPIPQGTDRAYRAVVQFTDMPPGFLKLSLESDDGLWLWVNGSFVGHWGGEWQQEGCVNENAGCLDSIDVEDQDITDLLVGGENVIAARVSNPVMDAWFELDAHCVDW